MAYNEGSESIAVQRYRLRAAGIVQGVGFRPFVYRLAERYRLSGSVSNQRGEVIIEVEGLSSSIYTFLDSLLSQAVEPIQIQALSKIQLPPVGEKGFRIHSSQHEGDASCCAVPTDLAICDACACDMSDPDSRFYHYPFTSCTDCGPRYTVIEALPYDRERTALAPFPLCEECRQEYDDPNNRRFHAQAIACPQCGPQIVLLDERQKAVSGDWLGTLHSLLAAGKITALKGLGGFHFICDASQAEAVKELRRRKKRLRKPLALMGRDFTTIERYFYVSAKEKEVICGRQAPIVLLTPKPELGDILPLSLIAPGMHRLGVMLPYTPLHRLMFDSTCLFLVATSGNKSGCPIARTNEEAVRDLREIADCYVLHNRDIAVRADDSVGQVIDEKFYLVRRSRGFVPEGMPFPVPDVPPSTLPVVLGAGGDMKNTFCLLRNGEVLLSHHVGEMDTVEALENYRQSVAHVLRLADVQPDVIGYDPHPDYRVSKEIGTWESKHRLAVYHHHAHMAACMAEHMLKERVIGCILDGTGYGRDGTMWGFEILVGDYLDFERTHSLKPLSLPGGEAAIRKPWLLTVACLYEAFGNSDETLAWANWLFPAYRAQLSLVMAQLDGRIPVPASSGAGRLFDAVSALLGICLESSYEGEAAMLLGEVIGDEGPAAARDRAYPFDSKDGKWHIGRLFRSILEDLKQNVPSRSISLTFHHTIAAMVLDGVRKAREKTGIRAVVLSGGVWHNRYLLSYTKARLQQEGFVVYTQQKIPAGDGGLAFGQAVSALWRWHQEHVSFRSGRSS